MTRTQIYLTDKEAKVLARLARETGRTRSQLIREAIEQAYLRAPSHDEILKALDGSAGSWKRRESGEKYVERIRSGRLHRIHGTT